MTERAAGVASIRLIFMAILMYAAAAGAFLAPRPALAFDSSAITDWLKEKAKDKGSDWLKDKAKETGEGWLFDSDQSETMKAILNKCQEATGGRNGLADKKPCEALVVSLAIGILSDVNLNAMGKDAARTAFDTALKAGTLLAGAGGAAVEGGLAKWMAGQYRDGLSGSAIDKLKELFAKEKIPEFEIFEKSGKNGVCDYSLRAVWDRIAGTYKVLINGDCHCAVVEPSDSSFRTVVSAQKLGAWWVSFEGKLLPDVDEAAKTVTWSPQPPTGYNFDAQCDCNNKTLKTPYSQAVKPVPPPAVNAVATKLPIPKKGLTVCGPCKSIQDEIDATWEKLDEVRAEFPFARAQATQAGDVGAKAADKVRDLGIQERQLEDKLRQLGKDLLDCIEKNCRGSYLILPGFPGEEDGQNHPQYVSNPGDDVAKHELALTDITTQQELPGGKVVLIPEDPKTPIPPPIPIRHDGHVTVPDGQPGDHLVIIPEGHKKIDLTLGDLPTNQGERIRIPQTPLRLIVHDTPCGEVTDGLVAEGLADQYGARPLVDTGGWVGADYYAGFGGFSIADCLVSTPSYTGLRPNVPLTDLPKDGPTRTHNGKIVEGDQPREILGVAPAEPFATSKGSWGQPYADQWYLQAVHWLKADGTSVLPAIGAPVIVAVIDTGVDFGHPELSEAMWSNPDPGSSGDRNGWNFVDRSPDIRDLSGHGTIVAGLIAASSKQHEGIAGINPWARIMAVKALEIDGKGGSIDVAQAILYAADHGARVINLSLGGRTLTRTEQDAIDYAARRDALVVAASGNDGGDTRNFSPAGLRNVLAVAAIGPDMKRQVFSNWGAAVGIAAPGVDILSLRARQTDLLQGTRRQYAPGSAVVADQYYRVTGSSFRRPIVSGAASLLFSLRPTMTAAQVKRVLLQSARDLDGIGTNQFTGYGLLDIEAALAADPSRYAEAAITGITVVQVQGGSAVRVVGTADADDLRDAHLEIGAGESPNHWAPVGQPLTKPVVNGLLADLPASAFRGGKQWILRVVVTNRAGLRREARFKLTLG